jgi:acetate kinase
VRINDEVIQELVRCIDFAPLHNPPNLKGIHAARKLLPDIPQVGVFDTAFHQTMPDYAYIYGIPYTLYKRHGIRRYGFHGTSHRFVSRRFAKTIGRPVEELKLITLHLGNGTSICAVENGRSVDTSMGFTPLEGLLMGTRSGDLDPAILLHVMAKEELTTNEMNTMLNKHSGFVGISGVSSDAREIEENLEENDRARLAADVFAYRAKKYIGAYAAAMNGVDAILFTGGIGENSSLFREKILTGLDYLGLHLDADRNQVRGQVQQLTTDDSQTAAWVIPTNEELVIARDTHTIVVNKLTKIERIPAPKL